MKKMNNVFASNENGTMGWMQFGTHTIDVTEKMAEVFAKTFGIEKDLNAMSEFIMKADNYDFEYDSDMNKSLAVKVGDTWHTFKANGEHEAVVY